MAILPTHLKKFTNIPLPEIIYFDTSFVIKVLIDEQRHFIQCREFIELLKKKQPIIVFSNLLRMELWHTRLIIVFQNLEKERHINFANCLKKYPNAPRRFYSEISGVNKLFNELLQNFKNWAEIPVEDKIINLALELIHKYNLDSYDAVHIATMLNWGIKDIVVFDQHIEDITDLNIWTNSGLKRYRKRHNLKT